MTRILVAEDDAAIQKLVSTILRKKGYAVSAARDGAEALQLIARGPFDILLLDMMMPVASGWAVIEELTRQQHPLLERTIVLTAASDKDVSTIPKHLRVMRKPFDMNELVLVVGRVAAATRSDTPVALPAGAPGVDRLHII